MSYRRRTRMISFRVSEDEFQQLKSKSESLGTGSVSDYARLSLCGETAEHSDHLAVRIHEDLQSLRTNVEQLATLVESTHYAVMGAGSVRQQGGGLTRYVDEDNSVH